MDLFWKQSFLIKGFAVQNKSSSLLKSFLHEHLQLQIFTRIIQKKTLKIILAWMSLFEKERDVCKFKFNYIVGKLQKVKVTFLKGCSENNNIIDCNHYTIHAKYKQNGPVR